jgi:hypothetical protein
VRAWHGSEATVEAEDRPFEQVVGSRGDTEHEGVLADPALARQQVDAESVPEVQAVGELADPDQR